MSALSAARKGTAESWARAKELSRLTGEAPAVCRSKLAQDPTLLETAVRGFNGFNVRNGQAHQEGPEAGMEVFLAASTLIQKAGSIRKAADLLTKLAELTSA